MWTSDALNITMNSENQQVMLLHVNMNFYQEGHLTSINFIQENLKRFKAAEDEKLEEERKKSAAVTAELEEKIKAEFEKFRGKVVKDTRHRLLLENYSKKKNTITSTEDGFISANFQLPGITKLRDLKSLFQ